jgi:ribosomal protein S18 acetylase RimI-like enzyme
MSETIHRNATVPDIPGMLELWRCFWPPQPYEANLERKITKDPGLVCVAECDGKIVGTIIGGFDDWWAWIYRVAVRPEYQRRGIGTRLFREMHRRLAARGANGVCLIASPSNKSMCGLLKKIGYNEKEDRRFSLVL